MTNCDIETMAVEKEGDYDSATESDVENDTDCDSATEADVENDSENEQEETTEKLQSFPAMGDVISKILEKELSSDNVILSKSKKSKKRKLEVEKEKEEQKEKQEKNKEVRELNHVVLSPGKSAPKEVILKRVATKGMVKLLNAVSEHQKTMSKKMKKEKTEAGKDKVAATVKKSDFMDLLRKPVVEKKKKKNEEKEKGDGDGEEDGEERSKKWEVLREDFMLGSTMKDWDKLDSADEEEDEHGAIEEDSDGDDDDTSPDEDG